MKVKLAFLLLFIQTSRCSLSLVKGPSLFVPESRKRDLVISNIVGKPVKFVVNNDVQSIVVDGQTVIASDLKAAGYSQEQTQDFTGQNQEDLIEPTEEAFDTANVHSSIIESDISRCAQIESSTTSGQQYDCPAGYGYNFFVEVSKREFCEDKSKLQGDINEINQLIFTLEDTKTVESPEIDALSFDVLLYYLKALSHLKHRLACNTGKDNGSRKLSFRVSGKIPLRGQYPTFPQKSVTRKSTAVHAANLRANQGRPISSQRSSLLKRIQQHSFGSLQKQLSATRPLLNDLRSSNNQAKLAPVSPKMEVKDISDLRRTSSGQGSTKTRRRTSLLNRAISLHNKSPPQQIGVSGSHRGIKNTLQRGRVSFIGQAKKVSRRALQNKINRKGAPLQFVSKNTENPRTIRVTGPVKLQKGLKSLRAALRNHLPSNPRIREYV